MAAMKAPAMPGAGPKGLGVLTEFIDKSTIECLNESKDHPVANAFDGTSETYLQSDEDVDSQLLLSVGFRLPVKISSVKVSVPGGCEEEAPTHLKIFTGQNDNLGFDDAESNEATQVLEVIPGVEMPLRFVKFQNIQFLKIFIQGSKGELITKISQLQFIGEPEQALDMKDWKPIKG